MSYEENASLLSLYDRMKARGIDMSWYEKGRRGRHSSAIPLDDDKCSDLSTYFLEHDGSLWTIDSYGKPYKRVRMPSKDIPKQIYVCFHCKQQSDELINLTHKE